MKTIDFWELAKMIYTTYNVFKNCVCMPPIMENEDRPEPSLKMDVKM